MASVGLGWLPWDSDGLTGVPEQRQRRQARIGRDRLQAAAPGPPRLHGTRSSRGRGPGRQADRHAGIARPPGAAAPGASRGGARRGGGTASIRATRLPALVLPRGPCETIRVGRAEAPLGAGGPGAAAPRRRAQCCPGPRLGPGQPRIPSETRACGYFRDPGPDSDRIGPAAASSEAFSGTERPPRPLKAFPSPHGSSSRRELEGLFFGSLSARFTVLRIPSLTTVTSESDSCLSRGRPGRVTVPHVPHRRPPSARALTQNPGGGRGGGGGWRTELGQGPAAGRLRIRVSDTVTRP